MKPRLKAKLDTKNFLSGGKFVQKRELYLYKNPNPKELLDIFKLFVNESDGFINGFNDIHDGLCELVCLTFDEDEIDFRIIPWIE